MKAICELRDTVAALTAQVKALQNVISSAGEKRGNTEIVPQSSPTTSGGDSTTEEAGLQSFEDASRETGTMVAEVL